MTERSSRRPAQSGARGPDPAFGQRMAASGGVVEIQIIPVAMRPAGYERCETVEAAVISAP